MGFLSDKKGNNPSYERSRKVRFRVGDEKSPDYNLPPAVKDARGPNTKRGDQVTLTNSEGRTAKGTVTHVSKTGYRQASVWNPRKR